MAVEIFTKEQFEKQALPCHKVTGKPLWVYLGVRQGEHAYRVNLPAHHVGIEVRSSVKQNGVSAGTGEDSIRCWLVDITTGQPMGSKISRWTTRVSGWGERTKEVIRQLWALGDKITPCPSCSNNANVPEDTDIRLKVFKVKKEGANKGRLFLKCNREGCKHFEWLDTQEEGEVKETQTVKPEPKKEVIKLLPLSSEPSMFSVAVPENKREELEKFLQSIGGRIIF